MAYLLWITRPSASSFRVRQICCICLAATAHIADLRSGRLAAKTGALEEKYTPVSNRSILMHHWQEYNQFWCSMHLPLSGTFFKMPQQVYWQKIPINCRLRIAWTLRHTWMMLAWY